MADGKWIDELRPNLPMHKAGRLILDNRLDAVALTWFRVLEGIPDPERVHAFRVTTRRATAAIRVIGDLLPSKSKKQLSRLLRKLRQAGGAARDVDVFALFLQKWTVDRPSTEQPGLDVLFGVALARRHDAQGQLMALIERRRKWDAIRKDLKCHRHQHETLAQRAAKVLPEVLAEFEKAAEKPLGRCRHLHQLRICGKRLRYALELFIDCYPDNMRQSVYPAIEAVQDILGDAHDAQIHGEIVAAGRQTLALFSNSLRERTMPGIQELEKHLRERVRSGPDRFHEWHRQWRALLVHVDFAQPMKSS